MEKMLKNLRKKTYSQLWIVAAFVALFAFADQGAYADDTYDAGADYGSYSYDSYSYDFAPAAEPPNYVVDWNNQPSVDSWNADNPTNTYNPAPVVNDWSMDSGWSYTAPSDTYSYTDYGATNYGSSVVDFGSPVDYTSFYSSPVIPSQEIYGDMSNLYNTPAEISAGLQALDGYLNPGVIQPQGDIFNGFFVNEPALDGLSQRGAVVITAGPFITVTETSANDVGLQLDNPSSGVNLGQDTSWTDTPATYGEYGEFTPGGYATMGVNGADDGFWNGEYSVGDSYIDLAEPINPSIASTPIVGNLAKMADNWLEPSSDLGFDSGYTADGGFIGPPAPVGVQLDSGYTAYDGFVGPPAPVTDTAAAAAIVSATVENKGGILEFIGEVAGGAVNWAGETIEPTGQLLFGKEGTDDKGIIGGTIDLTGRTADWIYEDAIVPTVEGTGQLLFGKEGTDDKGIIGGTIDLTGRTADWIYEDAIVPTVEGTGQLFFGKENDVNSRGLIGGTANWAVKTIEPTGQLLFGKEGTDDKGLIGGGIDLTARTASWIYDDAVVPTVEGTGQLFFGKDNDPNSIGLVGHGVGAAGDIGGGFYDAAKDIGGGFYDAGKDHLIEPVFKSN